MEANDLKRSSSVEVPEVKRTKGSSTPPIHEMVGGSSVRQYLNQHLTQHLLAGLKEIGNTKPEDPLRWLGEYLIKKSDEEKSTKTEDLKEEEEEEEVKSTEI
ncbi:hypothetical protein CAAN1_07S03928 [[Candida] anglica]|uniref:COMPASS component SDC1 n=1 Tax=[Candida] anglica TaxID=148631 RepID=A0ABP0EFV2_9ASCO